jgi:hypothetical protein
MEASQDVRWLVEVRDARWLGDALYDLLHRHEAALCLHDLLPDHPRVITTDFARACSPTSTTTWMATPSRMRAC